MVWVSLHTIISTTSCQPHHQGVGRWSSKDHTPRACEFAGETMEVAARRGIARSSVKSRETWLREWVGQCRGSSYSPSFINVFIQSLGHTPSDSLTHWFKNSLLHWVYASIHWLLIRSFVRSFIHSFVRLLVRSCIHSFLQPFVHSFTRSLIHSDMFFFHVIGCMSFDWHLKNHFLICSCTPQPQLFIASKSHKHSYRPLPTTARHYLASIISAFHGVWASIAWFNIHWASTCVNIYLLNLHIMFIPHELLIPRTWELGNCSSFNIPNIPPKNPCASICRATSLLGACAATRCNEQDTVVVIKCYQWVSISVANCKSMIC